MTPKYSHSWLPPSFPCFHCHPTTYIRLVQHLIERCLQLHMNRDECIRALAKYASIHPMITHTVWRGLQKENTTFFQAYFHASSSRPLIRYFHRKPRFGRRKYHRQY